MPSRARIVFLIKVPTDRAAEFMQAYQLVRYEVANGVPGHILDQVCQSPTDPEQWLITSEWTSIAYFQAWESSPEHRTLIKPMRLCMSEARSLHFEIRVQTSRSDTTAPPVPTRVPQEI